MIDPSAKINPASNIDDDVDIGAYAVIGKDVNIGSGSKIGPHAVINGPTIIGKNNKIFQFASIGEDPQDLKFEGETTQLKIGDNNIFREFVTINRGTGKGGGITRIGRDNLFMAYVHIAHDCLIGNQNIFANNTSLAGHIEIADHVTLGGFSLVSQFLKIGSFAFSAMGSVINQHVPPYFLVSGHMAKPKGINIIGLKRRGFEPHDLGALRAAYRLLYLSNLKTEEAIDKITGLESDKIQLLLDFINDLKDSKSGIIR